MRPTVTLFIAALCLSVLPGCVQPQASGPSSAQGLDNPVIAFNIHQSTDWSPGMRFLDLMKSARPWIGHKPGKWGGLVLADLEAGGYIDSDGWVRRIPAGIERVGTTFSWAEPDMQDYRKGRYILTYDGQGEIALHGDAEITSSQPGHMTITNLNGRVWGFDIIATDPNGQGDYLRNITLVAERHLPLLETGAVFNPDWVDLIKDARVLRFMDWQDTNKTDLVSWSQRVRPESPYMGRGHALEHMVQLANEVGADPWFTMPHMADSNFIRRFAQYVRDTLDPALIVRVEWSNEVWNYNYSQTNWTLAQAQSNWGLNMFRDYAVKKAAETSQIWRDVFASQPERLRTVFATHTGRPNFAERQLAAPRWQNNEPEIYVPSSEIFDELAVTNYFGGNFFKSQEERDAFLAAANISQQAANGHLLQRMSDPEARGSLPQIADKLRRFRTLSDQYGLDLILYEGGQHIHSALRPKAGDRRYTDVEIELMHETLTNFVRSSEMAQLYQQSWEDWVAVGQGPYMQFADVSRPGRFGSWGLYAGLGDSTPRARLLEGLAQRRQPWWEGAAAGPQYQHGAVFWGGGAQDRISGTSQEDYLLGQGGDDILIPGFGKDGLNGGDGWDRVILTGPRAAYTLTQQGAGWLVDGGNDVNFLIHIEEIEFADEVLTLP